MTDLRTASIKIDGIRMQMSVVKLGDLDMFYQFSWLGLGGIFMKRDGAGLGMVA